jgi:hypothetical protein
MPASDRISVRRLSAAALALAPAALSAALAFRAGGYLPAATSLAATEVVLAIVLWLILARDPLAAWSGPLSVGVAALVALAGWTALSATWSLSPELALPEATRALLYAGVLALGGLVASDAQRLRVLASGVAVAMLGLCLTALASRTLPDVLSVRPRKLPDRLAYPLSYWNALGFAAAVALILLVHGTVSARAGRRVRVAAATAVPLVVATLIATTSAGAAGAALAGLGLYAALARPRGLGRVVAALAIPSALAVWVEEAAPVATTSHPSAALLADAHRAAVLLVACAVAAGGLRVVALRFQPRLRRAALTRRAALAIVVLALGGAAAAGGASVGVRVDYWDVATSMVRSEPLHGEGAGTFALVWPRERDKRHDTTDAHSLYLECLAELGVVGLALLLVALATAGRALILRARAPGTDRDLHCALLAVAFAWALHAGVDWLWEQPAVSVPVFAIAGAALARAPQSRPSRETVPLRFAAIAACVVAAIVTGRLAISSADLEAARGAAGRGHCDEARGRARDALRVRPTSDAYLVLADCLLRSEPRAALAAVQRAAARDPHDWRVHYDNAVALAANGRDPRPEAGAAHGLNLLEPTAQVAQARFGSASPAVWREQALRVPFLLP